MVGNPTPHCQRHQRAYIPATSGTAGVAGNYFAIATNSFGSATTTVATVTHSERGARPMALSAFTGAYVSNAGTK